MLVGLDAGILDVLGHIGYLCLSIGMFLLAKQSIWGWPCRGVGESIWLFIGIEMQMSSMWVWGIIFLMMECYGYRSWKMAEKKLL